MADTLEVIILGTDKASPVFKDIGDNLGKAFKAGAGIAIGGLTALTAALGFSIKEAIDAEAVQAELAAVLKSTGGIAGVTADEVNTLATKLSKVTKFSDDTIVSAQSMLLTFTKIGDDIFPAATEATLNLAEKFGSVEQASIQIGKALNDPIAGVTALRRVGVSLTEQQEDMIKHFMEVGDIASAQQVILNELETEFGGLARTAGNTLGGKLTILKNRFMDVFESVGMKLMPALNKLADRVMDKVMPAIEGLIPIFDSLLWPVVRFIENLTKGISVGDAFKKLFADIGSTLQWFLDQLGIGQSSLGDIVASLIWPFQRLFENLSSGKGIVESLKSLFGDAGLTFQWFLEQLGVSEGVAKAVAGAFSEVGKFLTDLIFNTIVPFVKEHAEGFKAALIAIGGVLAGASIVSGVLAIAGAIAALFNPITLIIGGIALLAMAWTEDWGGIRTYLTDTVWPAVKPILQELKAWLEVNLPKAVLFLRGVWEEILVPAFNKLKTFWYETLKPALSNLVEWFMTFIPQAIDVLKGFWNDTLMPLFYDIKAYWDEHLQPFFETLVDFLSVVIGEAIETLAPIIEEVLIGALEDAKEAVQFLLDKFGELASSISTTVKWAIEQVTPVFNDFTAAIDTAKKALDDLLGIQSSSGPTITVTNPGSGPMVQARRGTSNNFNPNYAGPRSSLRDSGGSGIAGHPYRIGIPELFIPDRSGTFAPLSDGSQVANTISDLHEAVNELTNMLRRAGMGNPGSQQPVNNFNLTVNTSANDERIRSDFDTMRVMAGA